MLTILELEEITKKPRVNHDVSLKLIADFYLERLINKNYHFKLEDGTNINLRFSKKNLCHLLGVHYFCPDPSLAHLYKSHGGFDRIMEEQLTFDSLKAINSNLFKEYKERMQCFPFVYQILNECDIIHFNKDSVTGDCKIDIDFAMHNIYDNKRMHLGISLENAGDDIYYPKTFFISKGNKIGKYIEKQVQLTIVEKQIEFLNLEDAVEFIESEDVTDLEDAVGFIESEDVTDLEDAVEF